MTTSPSPRETLLDRVVHHVAANGLAGASLRELATAVGSSHRMLIYHFGSREGLIAAIVGRMEARQRATLAALAEEVSTPAELIRRQWAILTHPETLPFVRLFFDVLAQAAAGKPGTEGFLATLTEPWLELADEVSRRFEMRVSVDELRLGVAVTRGLLIEVLAAGDPSGPTAALELHLARHQGAG